MRLWHAFERQVQTHVVWVLIFNIMCKNNERQTWTLQGRESRCTAKLLYHFLQISEVNRWQITLDFALMQRWTDQRDSYQKLSLTWEMFQWKKPVIYTENHQEVIWRNKSLSQLWGKTARRISNRVVQIRRTSALTCGEVNVCDVQGGTQGQGKAAVLQEAPKVVHCLQICNIQLHIHGVLNLT